MTKEEAIVAMEQGGYKVAHRYFSKEECISSVDDEYFIDEAGLWLSKEEFWKCRQGEKWEDGWKIVG